MASKKQRASAADKQRNDVVKSQNTLANAISKLNEDQGQTIGELKKLIKIFIANQKASREQAQKRRERREVERSAKEEKQKKLTALDKEIDELQKEILKGQAIINADLKSFSDILQETDNIVRTEDEIIKEFNKTIKEQTGLSIESYKRQQKKLQDYQKLKYEGNIFDRLAAFVISPFIKDSTSKLKGVIRKLEVDKKEVQKKKEDVKNQPIVIPQEPNKPAAQEPKQLELFPAEKLAAKEPAPLQELTQSINKQTEATEDAATLQEDVEKKPSPVRVVNFNELTDVLTKNNTDLNNQLLGGLDNIKNNNTTSFGDLISGVSKIGPLLMQGAPVLIGIAAIAAAVYALNETWKAWSEYDKAKKEQEKSTQDNKSSTDKSREQLNKIAKDMGVYKGDLIREQQFNETDEDYIKRVSEESPKLKDIIDRITKRKKSEGLKDAAINQAREAKPIPSKISTSIDTIQNIEQGLQQSDSKKIEKIKKETGMDPLELFTQIGLVESSLNPEAGAKGTSAKGLFQFVSKTGQAYGLTAENIFNPTEQTKAMVSKTIDDINVLKKAGLPITPENIYMIHQQGSANILKAVKETPEMTVADYESKYGNVILNQGVAGITKQSKLSDYVNKFSKRIEQAKETGTTLLAQSVKNKEAIRSGSVNVVNAPTTVATNNTNITTAGRTGRPNPIPPDQPTSLAMNSSRV